jgi:hypothetical protein
MEGLEHPHAAVSVGKQAPQGFHSHMAPAWQQRRRAGVSGGPFQTSNQPLMKFRIRRASLAACS